MEREVDRLLAGLTTLGRPAEGDRGAPGQAPVSRAGTRLRPQVASPSGRAPTRADLVALWARVLLGIAFGALMTQWPYPHGCGPLLFVYLGAVATVMLAGAWIALASWKLRSAVAHVLSLILFFWGIVLAGEQVLPRIGYAEEHASWYCPAAPDRTVPARGP